MFVYKSRFLKRGEVWFENESNRARVDWILYRNRSRPVNGARWRYFYNRLIDLSKSADELLADMDSKTTAKITKAETDDKIQCDWCLLTAGHQFDEIELLWNQSVEAQRRWGMLNRAWLGEMISARVLEVASARESSGE